MPRARIPCLLLAAAALLNGCSEREDGALAVLWVGPEQGLVADGVDLAAGARHLRAATHSGLVTLDERAEVIPALAERWIITEDGLSFIFRLREGTWPDGSERTSESVRRALQRTIRDLRDTSLGLDLAMVEEIRAMTGRVVELRLKAPVPDLLRLLAQPELALVGPEGGTGPMVIEEQELVEEQDAASLMLRFRPPEQRGLPEQPDWEERVREIRLAAASAEAAVEQFEDGAVALVLGGRIDHLPLVDTGPLSRGTVRIEATIGHFGLRVRSETGLLADSTGREALAMAIDRQALMARYNLGGWMPTTRIVSPGLAGDPGYVLERWGGMSIEERRTIAAGRVAEWVQASRAAADADDPEPAATLSVLLGAASGEAAPDMRSPDMRSPGLNLLFRDLAEQLATIGVELVRTGDPREADLVLVDQVARYADPLWFLNQFDCSLGRGLCNDDADYLLELAREAIDPVERATLLAETEAELTAANIYIPFGMPLRWSLVRGSVTGFVANVYAFHPLPPLARLPN